MRTWSLPVKVHKYLYKKDKNKILGYLSRITALNQTGLFHEVDESYLRFVGAFRVQLLMDWGYYREALAWACLECEIYPENLRALIFKESIKKKIVNLPQVKRKKEIKTFSGWKGIAGMREVKTMVERDIILPLNNKDLYQRFKVPLPNGYLFYGPPGCGKTYFASKLAGHIGYDFIFVQIIVIMLQI